jgi:hypothetical protein
MKLYHCTAVGDTILAEGFRDTVGHWGMREPQRGVWVSADDALTANEGVKGDDVVVIEVPEAVAKRYEIIEDGKPYREFLIPADILNGYEVALLWRCEDHGKEFIQREPPPGWHRVRGRNVWGEPLTLILCDECPEHPDNFIPDD